MFEQRFIGPLKYHLHEGLLLRSEISKLTKLTLLCCIYCEAGGLKRYARISVSRLLTVVFIIFEWEGGGFVIYKV